MPHRHFALLFASFLVACSAGCSSLLPTTTRSDSPFKSFEAAREAFDAVEVGKTGADELVALGIDPERQGVTLVSGPQLIPFLLPNDAATAELHGASVRTCAEARTRCEGWLVDVERERSKRLGAWLLDVLRFRRVKAEGGFTFTGVLLLLDDRVQYKIWSGVPNRAVISTRVRPLGPLQGDTGVDVFNPLQLPPFTARVRAGGTRQREQQERFSE